MRRARTALAAAAVAGGLVLGFSSAGPGDDPSPALAGTTAAAGERGNAPVATAYQGRLLARRMAVAATAGSVTDLPVVRDRVTAALAGHPARPVNPAVLGAGAPPATPALVALLDAGAPAGAAADLVAALRAVPGVTEVREQDVVVHDFEVTVRPEVVPAAEVVGRVRDEGVLADYLGEYTDSAPEAEAEAAFGYAGPVLADTEVEAVLEAVSTAAGGAPAGLRGRGDDPGLRLPGTGDGPGPAAAVSG